VGEGSSFIQVHTCFFSLDMIKCWPNQTVYIESIIELLEQLSE